jgi:hypothetical protein
MAKLSVNSSYTGKPVEDSEAFKRISELAR